MILEFRENLIKHKKAKVAVFFFLAQSCLNLDGMKTLSLAFLGSFLFSILYCLRFRNLKLFDLYLHSHDWFILPVTSSSHPYDVIPF